MIAALLRLLGRRSEPSILFLLAEQPDELPLDATATIRWHWHEAGRYYRVTVDTEGGATDSLWLHGQLCKLTGEWRILGSEDED